MALLSYSKYSLWPKQAVNSKHAMDEVLTPILGLHLKLTHKNENLYTSLTLHPALGDPPVETAIKQLETQLSYVILENFKEEYLLKTKEKYFLDFVGHELRTHATIAGSNFVKEDLKQALGNYKQGFKRFKFKVGAEFFANHEFYFNFLNQYQDVEFIFDFNSNANFIDLKKLGWTLPVLRRTFWEDPLNMADMTSLGDLKSQGFQLILDQKNMLHHQGLKHLDEIFDIVAVKPTKESVKEVLQVFPKAKIMITTNMGSELDHVISAHWANYVFTHHRDRFFGAGLYTRHFFRTLVGNAEPGVATGKLKDNELDPKVRSSFLNIKNTDMLRGWGLDSDLSKLDWTVLREIDVEF